MIAKQIELNQTPWIWDENLVDSHPNVSDPYNEMSQLYYEKLSSMSSGVSSTKLKFCYTAMHGVGYRFAAKAFKAFKLAPFIPVDAQVEPDPEFPTVAFPNPEEGKGALKLAIETANASNCSVILANDPDADRLAVAEKLSEQVFL